jgi:hypothetical protein
MRFVLVFAWTSTAIKNAIKKKNIIKQTPVDELQIKEYPFVNFRINDNTWLEVLVIYLVEPGKAGAMRTRMIKKF